jgi:hypothetical protein
MRRFTGRAGSVLTIAMTLMAFALGGVGSAEAQGGWSAADGAAIKGYLLTMDKLRRANQVMIEFDRLEKTRDDLADDDEDDTQSVAAMVARINAVPEARAVLKKHGLTSRDYVLALLASTHAAAAALMEESGGQATGMPVSPRQVKFYKANKAEIDKLQAERKAAAGAGEGGDEDDIEE